MNFTPFSSVCEAYFSNFTAGCFSAGDVIAFDIKLIKTLDSYKSLPMDVKTRLDGMMESQQAGDSVIVVTAVSLNPMIANNVAPATMTIAYSHGGGRWIDPITIPGSLGEGINIVEQGVNLNNKIPRKARINYTEFNTSIRPVDLEELEKNRTKGVIGGTEAII